MKIKNKVTSVAMALALTGLTACGSDGGTSSGGIINFDSGSDGSSSAVQIVLPDYDAKKDELTFLTSAFFSPVVTEESMKEYTDCGFDVMWINGNNVGYGDSESIRKALAEAEKQGVKCVIDATISRSEPVTKSMICNDYGYQKYSSLWAVNAYDEPVRMEGDWTGTAGIDTLAKYLPKFRQIYGNDMPYFVNLNPFPSTERIKPDYKTYIQTNIDLLLKQTGDNSQKWLSADSYPLMHDPYQDRYFVKDVWLYNLQLFADAKKDNKDLDIKTNFFILSTPHRTKSPTTYIREVGYNELRMQMYSLIAFGYDMVSYFTYATPPASGGESFEDSLLDVNGKKTQRWHDAQKLNAEIHNFDHVFLQFDYKGVYAVDGTGENHYSNDSFSYLKMLDKEELGELDDITATADTLIGMGVDEKGNGGYTVVNYNDPYYDLSDEVTLTFKNANKAVVYVAGKKEIKSLTDNKLTLKLGVGEGVFVIPFTE